MPPVIIADTSCLILLDKIGELSLLQKLYVSVFITQIIANEFGDVLPEWIVIKNPSANLRQELVDAALDKGETSAIALALENNSVLIMDEQKGRKVAKGLGIRVTGTLGVVAQAKLQGHIPAALPIIQKMIKTDFRLRRELIENTLRQLNEGL